MKTHPILRVFFVFLMILACGAMAQTNERVGWLPGSGEPIILPDVAYKRAKQALEKAYPDKATWILETLSVGAERSKGRLGIAYPAYRLTFSRRSQERPISENVTCDVLVLLSDGRATVGQLRNE
ncbi:MAG: hypothetical protein JWL59_539 [Chthoniobacteraceae bacterium]|nr:hypothetical protein [Chthoniobacteraceae bacterium]